MDRRSVPYMPKTIFKPLISTQRIKRKGKYYQVTRDAKGKFRAFKKWKPIKKMWRLTVAINYYEHWVEGCLKIQAWSRRKSKLKAMIPLFKEMLMDAFEKRFPYPDEELWFEYRIGTELTQVPFDSTLVETQTDVKDEIIKIHERGKVIA
jgi:hypothetical protein